MLRFFELIHFSVDLGRDIDKCDGLLRQGGLGKEEEQRQEKAIPELKAGKDKLIRQYCAAFWKITLKIPSTHVLRRA